MQILFLNKKVKKTLTKPLILFICINNNVNLY